MEEALEQPRLVPQDQPGVQEAWDMVASQLRMEMKPGLYDSWVAPLRPMGFKEGVYRVGAVNPFGRDWVESHLRSRITRLLESLYHRPVSVNFTLLNSASRPDGTPTVTAKESGNGKVAAAGASEQAGSVEKTRRKKDQPEGGFEGGSARKIQLQRAYGTERARVIQPERGMFLTMYFFNAWLPLLGHSAATTVLAARSLCYWNPMTGELRNVVETDMSELARRAAVSVRTVKDVLNNDLVKRFFLRYKVRRVMTPNGVRTAGILLQVRMDDPLTPEDQENHQLVEDDRWYTAGFDEEDDD